MLDVVTNLFVIHFLPCGTYLAHFWRDAWQTLCTMNLPGDCIQLVSKREFSGIQPECRRIGTPLNSAAGDFLNQVVITLRDPEREETMFRNKHSNVLWASMLLLALAVIAYGCAPTAAPAQPAAPPAQATAAPAATTAPEPTTASAAGEQVELRM